jgi:hypothetical protein
MYRFGTTRYKVTVAELTARRFWTGLVFSPWFLDRQWGSIPGRLTRLKDLIL